MITEAKEEIKVLHESIFWDEDDPRWRLSGRAPVSKCFNNTTGDFCQVIDLQHDSYVIAYSGPRGAGKTIAMTYYAAQSVYLWDKRLVSNYPISFVLIKGNSRIYVEAEPLDMYKLLCFDEDYKNCLILIDESPDIISHMAAQTWKNRLLNIFIRQLRKNMNSLFLGTQQLGLIDKSMRWQTDIAVRCKDAYRLYGGSEGLERGACVLLDLYDKSGQWTGRGIDADWDAQLDAIEPTDSYELAGSLVWGAFDTYYQQDIFESLRRVDMSLRSYDVGDAEKPDYSGLKRVLPVIDAVCNDGKKVDSTELYNAFGELSDKETQFLGKALIKAGVKNSRNGRTKDFTDFDRDKFERILE